MATTSKIKMIDNYIYFYHLDKFCVLPSYPETITDSLSSSFAQTNALSRSAPVFSYSNSGPRSVNISLKLHRDMMNDLNKNVSNIKHGEMDLNRTTDFSSDDYIDTLVGYLQSAALPKYQAYNSASKTVIPPMVAIRFGNTIFIKGVVNSGIQCTYSKPILYNDKYAIVDVIFTVYETEPFDADTVAALGSFRGITHAFNDGVYSTDSEGNNDIQNVISLDKIKILKKKGYGSTTHYSSSAAIHGGGGSHKFASSESSTSASSSKWSIHPEDIYNNSTSMAQNKTVLNNYYNWRATK